LPKPGFDYYGEYSDLEAARFNFKFFENDEIPERVVCTNE